MPRSPMRKKANSRGKNTVCVDDLDRIYRDRRPHGRTRNPGDQRKEDANNPYRLYDRKMPQYISMTWVWCGNAFL